MKQAQMVRIQILFLILEPQFENVFLTLIHWFILISPSSLAMATGFAFGPILGLVIALLQPVFHAYFA